MCLISQRSGELGSKSLLIQSRKQIEVFSVHIKMQTDIEKEPAYLLSLSLSLYHDLCGSNHTLTIFSDRFLYWITVAQPLLVSAWVTNQKCFVKLLPGRRFPSTPVDCRDSAIAGYSEHVEIGGLNIESSKKLISIKWI